MSNAAGSPAVGPNLNSEAASSPEIREVSLDLPDTITLEELKRLRAHLTVMREEVIQAIAAEELQGIS